MAVCRRSNRGAVLHDDARILRVTERPDVSATAADGDAPSLRATVPEERHVGRGPVNVAARGPWSQSLPAVVPQETGHAGRVAAAVDVPRGAPEVERPSGASRRSSESLRDEYRSDAEDENESGAARRHREPRLPWPPDVLAARATKLCKRRRGIRRRVGRLTPCCSNSWSGRRAGLHRLFLVLVGVALLFSAAAGQHAPTAEAAHGPLGGVVRSSAALAAPVAFERRVVVGADDAEEFATGSMYLTSSDLELVYDGSNQRVGIRFTNVTIPKGATITKAYLQFEAKETQSEATSLAIQGQAADNAATFTSASGNISTRARTGSSISWTPPAWTLVGEAGANQRSPDLSPAIQEILNRNNWASGNALALIITGTGHRTAWAYDGKTASAPLLHIEYTTAPPPPNTAPVANAGPDLTVTLPAAALLHGTVSDDGLPSPPATTTAAWTLDSGPGAASFLNANAADTQATFSLAGTYVLRLTASDSALNSSDTTQVTVLPASSGGATLERRVVVGADDAEEFATGSMYLTGSDLELVYDGSNQRVGTRFPTVTIPKGPPIPKAYLQFEAKETQSEATSLAIQGQAADNAATFTSASGNISTRARTGSSISWTPPAWTLVGEAGANQRSPDLSPAIQEILNRNNWASGNALALIITGTGHRTAWAYDGKTASAPLLHIEYTTAPPPPNTAPVANACPDLTVTLPAAALLHGTVSDDGLPSPPATTTATWTLDSGPGAAGFLNANAADTQATFSLAGTYVLRLAASDSALNSSDTTQVTVLAAPPPP